MVEMTLGKKISIFMRSFFIQGAWNYMRLQNIGYLFIVKNRLKDIYPDKNSFKKAILRHFDMFNTQPYMASVVIGNVLRMEEKDLKGKESNIISIRHRLACAYASIGDRLFWSRLRIVAFELTVFIFVLFFNPMDFQNMIKVIILAVFAPTLLYALFSIYIRWKGFDWGYQCGGKDLCGLNFIDWNKIIKFSSLIGFLLSVFILFFLSFMFVYSLIGKSIWNLIFNLFPILFGIFVQRYFKNKKKTLLSPIVAIILFSFLFEFLSIGIR